MSQTVIVNRLPRIFELLRFARTWPIRALAVLVDTRVRVALAATLTSLGAGACTAHVRPSGDAAGTGLVR